MDKDNDSLVAVYHSSVAVALQELRLLQFKHIYSIWFHGIVLVNVPVSGLSAVRLACDMIYSLIF